MGYTRYHYGKDNSSYKHGDTNSYLYNAWCRIKARCYNKNHPRYKDYGGRGILVYNKWIKSYVRFKYYILLSIGERPSKNHSLDRIDNDGFYAPKNLRWATPKQQANNRRKKKLGKNDVRAIRYLLNNNSVMSSQIATLFSISDQTVCDIKKNRTHKI